MRDPIKLRYENPAKNSDKTYSIDMKPQGDGFMVVISHGKTGRTQRIVEKTKSPVTEQQADELFDSILNSQLSDGYQVIGGASTLPAAVTNKQVVPDYMPQLSEEERNEEEIQRLLSDPNTVMEEKLDGDRRTLVFDQGVVYGLNKQGVVVEVSPEIETAFREMLDASSITGKTVLDGEDMGSWMGTWTALFIDGTDLRGIPYREVRVALIPVIQRYNGDTIRIVPQYTTPAAKKIAFKKIRERGGEGVVFKNKNDHYKPGKSNHIKVKNWATADMIVTALSNTKSSVEIGCFRGDELVVCGNVTIYSNSQRPARGDVIQVRYLYAFSGGSLFEPVYEGIRTDKSPEECLYSQLKIYKP